MNLIIFVGVGWQESDRETRNHPIQEEKRPQQDKRPVLLDTHPKIWMRPETLVFNPGAASLQFCL